MVGQLFLPVGEGWFMHNANTQCTVERGEEAKGQRNFLSLSFSCLAIVYEFCFMNGNSGFEINNNRNNKFTRKTQGYI